MIYHGGIIDVLPSLSDKPQATDADYITRSAWQPVQTLKLQWLLAMAIIMATAIATKIALLWCMVQHCWKPFEKRTKT
jgi:hypothetical protein